MDSRWPALHAPWAPSVRRPGAAVAEAKSHIQHQRRQVAFHRPPGQDQTPQNPSRDPRPWSSDPGPWSRGRDPAPGAGAARLGCAGGGACRGPPLCLGYNSPERWAAARGWTCAPCSGETGLAEGCLCGESGGQRDSGWATFTLPLRRGSVELRCLRKRSGVWVANAHASQGWWSSAAFSFSSPSRTWTSRTCGWRFCCQWWLPWISDTTTRKGWRRS